VVRAEVLHVPGGVVGDTNQRVVGRGCGVVAVVPAFGEAVELRALQRDGRTTSQAGRNVNNGRRPRRISVANWRVDLHFVRAVGFHDLAGRQNGQAVLIGTLGVRTGRSRDFDHAVHVVVL